jgi:hypothetical protein
MSAQPDPATVARYVDETAPLIGLPIPAACREGIVRNLSGILTAGPLLGEFPVGDTETAPAFEP